MLAFALFIAALGVALSETVRARYRGRCAGCRDVIWQGDPIVFDYDRHAYMHEECADCSDMPPHERTP